MLCSLANRRHQRYRRLPELVQLLECTLLVPLACNDRLDITGRPLFQFRSETRTGQGPLPHLVEQGLATVRRMPSAAPSSFPASLRNAVERLEGLRAPHTAPFGSEGRCLHAQNPKFLSASARWVGRRLDSKYPLSC